MFDWLFRYANPARFHGPVGTRAALLRRGHGARPCGGALSRLHGAARLPAGHDPAPSCSSMSPRPSSPNSPMARSRCVRSSASSTAICSPMSPPAPPPRSARSSPRSASSPARSGDGRCGAPIGCGTRASPRSFVLLFLYLGYMALWSAIEDETRAARAAAILALVGAVNLPIIKFSVDWWNTLHQGESIMSGKIAPVYLWPLLLMALGYALLFATSGWCASAPRSWNGVPARSCRGTRHEFLGFCCFLGGAAMPLSSCRPMASRRSRWAGRRFGAGAPGARPRRGSPPWEEKP